MERLPNNNQRVGVGGESFHQQNWANVRPVQTNIVTFDRVPPPTASDLL
ncbi:MAG: hypothetical protein MUC59_13255 [Saprospiraceae bacterium]|nr:hypothetical protein [Saprospiraceae bacterium]